MARHKAEMKKEELLMFKKKGMRKRIVSLVLAAAMVITLIPQIETEASGVTVDGYPVYNDIIYEAIKGKITNTAFTNKDTVYGGIGSWFYWGSENRVNLTHVYHNSSYISSRVNLRPSVSVISSNDQSWEASFEANDDFLKMIKNNPEVSMIFGGTFVSTKNKPSMSLNGVTLGGSSLSKKSTKSLEGTAKYPYAEELALKVWGASGTNVKGMWIAAIDNTSATYTNVTVDYKKYDGLYFYIQMDEDVRWANSGANQYADDMYIEFYLMDTLTNVEGAKLKAAIYDVEEDIITFRCDEGDMGDFVNKEFQVTRISKANMPVINGISFAVYGVRGCLNYQSGYDRNTRQTIYTNVGNYTTYLQDVTLDTTPITDLAGNKVELGAVNLIGKNICFDYVAPEIDEITLTDSSGTSRADAAKMAGKEENSWPEDINRKDLFLGINQGINASLLISEPVNTSDVKVKLNVLDENGKQVELQLASTEFKEPGTYGERTRTLLRFETFTAKSGMKMMSGHEGQPIKVISISGTITDKKGNSLNRNLPAPDKQIFLDITAPEITVEKLATKDNSRDLQFLVTVNDKTSNELSAGILGEYATMKLKATALTELNYNYTVVASDGKTLSSGTGTMSGEKEGVIRWKMHAHNSYAATVKIKFTNTNKITVDEIQAQVSATDILKNQVTGAQGCYPFVVDEVAPVITINPAEYTSTSEKTTVKVPIQVSDYTEVASLQYQWTENDVTETALDNSKWTAVNNLVLEETKKQGTASVTLTDLEESTQKILWVKAGDNKDNFSVESLKVVVTIKKPRIYYDASAVLDVPDESPVVTVVGAAKKSQSASQNKGAEAHTRVTVTMGKNTYVRIVPTDKTMNNVFDFDGTWYQVTFTTDDAGNCIYNEVTEITDTTALKNYYGKVLISFDAAYGNLTPAKGNALDAGISDNSYINDTTEIEVLYAPVKDDPSNVHKVTFGKVMDGTGTSALAEDGTVGNSPIVLDQIAGAASVIGGTQFHFSLSNLLISKWDIKDIDFSKSYVELNYTNSEGTTTLDTEILQSAIEQLYVMPTELDYETGMYSITVYVYQKGAAEPAKYQSLNIVLDAATIQNAGLWEYTIYPNSNWIKSTYIETQMNQPLVYSGDTAPLESVGLSLSPLQEVKRDNVFAYYTAGASNVEIHLECNQTIEEYNGIKVGEVVGFRMWNSLSGITEEELNSDNFIKSNTAPEGRAQGYYYLGIKTCDAESIKETDFVTSGQSLPVVSGVNTFYYQVKLANGTISEIRQFTVMVTDITPTLELSVESYVESLKNPNENGQINVSSITLQVENACSMNGNGDVTISLYKQGNADITRDGASTHFSPSSNMQPYELQLNDLITFDEESDNTYSNSFKPTDTVMNMTKTSFIVFDEFGGAMAVCPQIGDVRRVGHTGNEVYYNVNYQQYHFAGINNNTIHYNVPVTDEETGEILYYETINELEDKTLSKNYTDLEYNKFAIDTTEWTIAPFNRTDSWYDRTNYKVSLLKQESESKYASILPELVDYDSIYFSYDYEENGETKTFTAPIVESYNEPNPMGYMGAEWHGNEMYVYIANPVNKEITSMDYEVHYKDIYGNDYSMGAHCGLSSVDGSVNYDSMGDAGIELYVNAIVPNRTGTNKDYGVVQTGLFLNGTRYTGTYTDMYGEVHEVIHTITNGWDCDVEVSYSTMEPTFGDVKVSLVSKMGFPITVEEAEGIEILSEGNGSASTIELSVSKNMDISFTTTVGSQQESFTFGVGNIVDFEPMVLWDFDEESILTDEDGTTYINGPVTAYIVDKDEAELELVDVLDKYTQKTPSYTFYPGEEESYTFVGSDYYAVLGGEQINGVDLEITLPVDELRSESFDIPSEDIPMEDTDAPAIQLRAYAQRNGIYQNENMALQVEPGIYGLALSDYDGDTIFENFENRADTTEFLEKIGWATTYRFQIELVDESDVKFFIKKGQYASAPNYDTGTSDDISGVTLNGRVLEVETTGEFTLFAVDENGNTTVIPFNVTNVGEAPVPQVKTIYAGTNAYVYVLSPVVDDASDITDFKLTGPTGIAKETEAGDYYDKWYLPCDKNGTYTINYSYIYMGKEIIGKLEVIVDEIDSELISPTEIKWSANKSQIATNQDVTVQLTYNKEVKEIVVPSGFEYLVEVLLTGNRVTVRYQDNLPTTLDLTTVAYNETQTTLKLDAVTNIDKESPVVSAPSIVLAEDGKSVTVSFEVDEESVLNATNNYGTKTENGYVHSKKVTKNGSYTYSFTDKAGNVTQVDFEVKSIVDTPLNLWFNTSASDTDAKENPEDFQLNVGEQIFVKANRACEISLNKGEPKSAAADTWISFEITDNEAGLWPVVYAVDVYGNTDSALLHGVKPLDKEAPVIIIKKEQIYVKAGTERAEILAMLENNMIVNDVDADVEVNIVFTENLTTEGTTTVTYTATDSSGNSSTKSGWLKLTSASEPKVMIDGESVGRDSIYLGSLEDALKLTIDTEGEPYSVTYKKGVLTTAQMKIGTTTLVRDAVTAEEVALPCKEAGYYTICIRTQSRDEYLFIVYVE